MTKSAPVLPHDLLQPFNPFPSPTRLIGKIPVFEDEHGEFSLITVKLWHPKTKEMEEIQVKSDADIEAIRNVHALILRRTEEISKKTKQTEGTLGYVVYQNGNNKTVSGQTSLPRTLFGHEYHYARHVRDDDRDFRKAAFLPKE